MQQVAVGGQALVQARQPQAVIHFLAEGFGEFEFVVGDGAHQGDATARAVAFALGFRVGRAARQAQAAVHALLERGVIEVAKGFHQARRATF